MTNYQKTIIYILFGPTAEKYVETLKSKITKIQSEIDDFNKLKNR